MRMLVADRDREQQNKVKVEDEMRMQNERMELIEDSHRRQQDTAQNNWKQEKVLKHAMCSFIHSLDSIQGAVSLHFTNRL